jgi:hypothetical protein
MPQDIERRASRLFPLQGPARTHILGSGLSRLFPYRGPLSGCHGYSHSGTRYLLRPRSHRIGSGADGLRRPRPGGGHGGLRRPRPGVCHGYSHFGGRYPLSPSEVDGLGDRGPIFGPFSRKPRTRNLSEAVRGFLPRISSVDSTPPKVAAAWAGVGRWSNLAPKIGSPRLGRTRAISGPF